LNLRKILLVGGLVVVVAVIAGLFVGRHPGGPRPADETAFINGMTPIMAQVQDPAGTDLASWRQKRAAMICQVITNLQVTDWIGTVDRLDSSIAGGAIMSVAVMPDVDFGTATNLVSNMSSDTFIEPASALFHTISLLQVGQKIRFSGQLFASPQDCIQEASVTDSGSMQNPLFITRFTSITPLPHSDS
jgi:hypothetical protein